MIEQQERIPDLVLNICPLTCNDCKRIYLNNQIGHRIICGCRCHSLAEEKREQEGSLQGATVPAQRQAAATVDSGGVTTEPSE
jgi:hypothetical protein